MFARYLIFQTRPEDLMSQAATDCETVRIDSESWA